MDKIHLKENENIDMNVQDMNNFFIKEPVLIQKKNVSVKFVLYMETMSEHNTKNHTINIIVV